MRMLASTFAACPTEVEGQMPHAESTADPAAELLHVLDLPQLYQKPSAQDLLQTLALLAVQAPSWDHNDKARHGTAASGHKGQQVAPEGVPKYLTSIIASQLRWIEDEEQKTKIWEEASLRLAERSGRSAMPAISRSFIIPTDSNSFELMIYEPSLTGDSLGLKTWAASYLLSKRLYTIQLPSPQYGQLRILELGSGTGLVGMAAAAALGASVLLTDLPEIEHNLVKNVLQNQKVIGDHGGKATAAVLDWAKPTEIIASQITSEGNFTSIDDEEGIRKKFPVIVAADSIYSAEHPAMLVNAIKTWLAPGRDARVILELPRREAYTPELEHLKDLMLQGGLRILEQGEETGYDDWGGLDADERLEVNCWWSVWSWAASE